MLRKMFKNKWFGYCVLFPVLFISLFMLAIHYADKQALEKNEKELAKQKTEIKSEAKRRLALQDKSQPESHQSDINSEIEQGVLDLVKDNQSVDGGAPVAANDPGDAMITQGPHKGMTVKEYERHKAYMSKKSKIMDRYKVHIQKEIEYADNLLASSRKERHAILSVFKNLSPEQLKHAREELVNNDPKDAESINNFFDDIHTYHKASTPEEFTREVQDILTYDEALDVVRKELDVEKELIDLELKDLNKKYPEQQDNN